MVHALLSKISNIGIASKGYPLQPLLPSTLIPINSSLSPVFVFSEREREKMSYSKLDADEGEMDPVNEVTEKMSYAKLEDGGEEGGKGEGKNGQPLRAKSFDGFEDPSQPLLLSGNNTSVNYEVCPESIMLKLKI